MSKQGKALFFIILLIIFVFLVVYIGTYMYKLYASTKSFSSETTQGALACGDYFLDIDDYSLDGNNLELTLKNKQHEISSFTVIINEDSLSYNTTDFIKGSTKKFTLKNMSKDTIWIYPENCIQNKVILDLNDTQ